MTQISKPSRKKEIWKYKDDKMTQISKPSRKKEIQKQIDDKMTQTDKETKEAKQIDRKERKKERLRK